MSSYLSFFVHCSYRWIQYFLHLMPWTKKPHATIPNNVIILSETDRYIENKTNQLLMTYLSKEYNSNIHPCFYVNDQYQEKIKELDNDLEKEWKRRLLLESTPRGNIVMYYDAFKRGFAYYSDVHIPYSLINAVAMKYVMMFRCRDFFLDEQIVPAANRSPFIDLLEKDEKKEREKKTNANRDYSIDTKKGPFAKLKNYSNPATPTSSIASLEAILPGIQSQISQNVKMMPLQMKNKFVYLGKLSNFSAIRNELPVNHKKLTLSEVPFRFKDYMKLKMGNLASNL